MCTKSSTRDTSCSATGLDYKYIYKIYNPMNDVMVHEPGGVMVAHVPPGGHRWLCSRHGSKSTMRHGDVTVRVLTLSGTWHHGALPRRWVLLQLLTRTAASKFLARYFSTNTRVCTESVTSTVLYSIV